MALELQRRDLEFLRWVNGFGFVTRGAAAVWFGSGYRTAAARVAKLVKAGLLVDRRVDLLRMPVLMAARRGIEVSGDELGPARNVNLGTLAHDLAVLDIGTRLGKEPGQSFKPERRLRHERSRAAAVSRYGRENVGLKGHVPDGLVTFDDGRTAAVEVELTHKNVTRLKRIVDGYKTSFDEDRVWYYVRGEALRARITELCAGMSKFEIREI